MNNEPCKDAPDDQQIYKKIENLVESNPAFLSHIIHATYPTDKIKRVENFVKQGITDRRCCLSDVQLIDIYSIAQLETQITKVDINALLMLYADTRTPIQIVEQKIPHGNNKRLALTGEKTNRILSLAAYNVLSRYIANQYHKGAPKIKKIINSEFVAYYFNTIQTKFDVAIKYNDLPQEALTNFKAFVDERYHPMIMLQNISYKNLWDAFCGTFRF